ncbi:MAG: HEAT repeat domain-containing protein [Bacteroidetes bacterium]|nr:HEAT repeat domain-containing protein [Bacteroidota bacterium]
MAFGQGLQVDILQDLTGLIGRLIDLLQDKDELVRAAAAATLGLRGNVLSIPALKAAAINASEATKAVFDQCQTQLRESEAAATAKCKTALGRELKPLEAAVFISWSKHLKGWQFASTFPEIPSRKLTGATGRYAKIGSQEVVVGLIDHTIFGSAKDGFLATTSAFYWNYVGPVKSGHIVYREIEPSSVTYDTRTRRLSAGGRGLVDPPDSEGQAIANFLYDVILSLKLESEKGK